MSRAPHEAGTGGGRPQKDQRIDHVLHGPKGKRHDAAWDDEFGAETSLSSFIVKANFATLSVQEAIEAGEDFNDRNDDKRQKIERLKKDIEERKNSAEVKMALLGGCLEGKPLPETVSSIPVNLNPELRSLYGEKCKELEDGRILLRETENKLNGALHRIEQLKLDSRKEMEASVKIVTDGLRRELLQEMASSQSLRDQLASVSKRHAQELQDIEAGWEKAAAKFEERIEFERLSKVEAEARLTRALELYVPHEEIYPITPEDRQLEDIYNASPRVSPAYPEIRISETPGINSPILGQADTEEFAMFGDGNPAIQTSEVDIPTLDIPAIFRGSEDFLPTETTVIPPTDFLPVSPSDAPCAPPTPHPTPRNLHEIDFEFLTTGDFVNGERTTTVSLLAIAAVERMKQKWITCHGRNWAKPSTTKRFVEARYHKLGIKAAGFHEHPDKPQTACSRCVRDRNPCVLALPGMVPCVLPLPVARRESIAATELGYYVLID